MEQTKLKRFKRILFTFIFAIVLCGGWNIISNDNQLNAKSLVDTVITNPVYTNTPRISKRDSIQSALISEVSNYLRRQAPNAHKFIPKYLVQAGLNYDIDICFMMAQTQIETNFGTMGAGREVSRRSLFGVAARRYGDYEIAVNDYCRLLKKSYLGKGRTEKHLMTKYITHGGARYAGNPRYEAELSKTYRDILKRTNIHVLQLEWKNT